MDLDTVVPLALSNGFAPGKGLRGSGVGVAAEMLFAYYLFLLGKLKLCEFRVSV